jgi:spore germination protein GerM
MLLGALPAALMLSGCTADPVPATTASRVQPQTAAGTPFPGIPTTSAPLETAQTSNKAPVYWIGRSDSKVFLYREFRDVEEQENSITSALRAMMAEKPLDPDFFTPWQNPKELATSISGKNVITVDVSADAFNSNLDPAMADRAIQQLIYTATAAGASSGLIDAGQQIQVVVLVDGHTDYLAFDHVRLGSPMSRAAGMVAPVWIIDPQERVELPAGSVKITGRGTRPGGKLSWRILRGDEHGDKQSYLSGETTAAPEPAQAGVFTFAVNLAPGTYELRISEFDETRSGQEPNVDSRTFTVK